MKVITSIEEIEFGKFYRDPSGRYYIYTTSRDKDELGLDGLCFEQTVAITAGKYLFRRVSEFVEVAFEDLPMWVKVSLVQATDGTQMFDCEEANQIKQNFISQLHAVPKEKTNRYLEKLYNGMYKDVSGCTKGITEAFPIDLDKQVSIAQKPSECRRLVRLVLACADRAYSTFKEDFEYREPIFTEFDDIKCIKYVSIIDCFASDVSSLLFGRFLATASYYARKEGLDDLDIFPDLEFDKVPESPVSGK